jgi:hypothetical protein
MPQFKFTTPKWEELLKGIERIPAKIFRDKLGRVVEHVRREKKSVALVNHRDITAILVTPQDGARLEMLKRHPNLLQQLEKLHPELRD